MDYLPSLIIPWPHVRATVNVQSYRFHMDVVLEWCQHSGSSQAPPQQAWRWWSTAWWRWRRGKAPSWPGFHLDILIYLTRKKKLNHIESFCDRGQSNNWQWLSNAQKLFIGSRYANMLTVLFSIRNVYEEGRLVFLQRIRGV